MNWETIKTNLASSAIIGVLSIGVGFLLGTSQTSMIANDLERVQDDVVTLKANDKVQRQFLNCVQLALQSSRDKSDATRICELSVE